VKPFRVLQGERLARLPIGTKDELGREDGEAPFGMAIVGNHAVEPTRNGKPRNRAVCRFDAELVRVSAVVRRVRAPGAVVDPEDPEQEVRALAPEVFRVAREFSEADGVFASDDEERSGSA